MATRLYDLTAGSARLAAVVVLLAALVPHAVHAQFAVDIGVVLPVLPPGVDPGSTFLPFYDGPHMINIWNNVICPAWTNQCPLYMGALATPPLKVATCVMYHCASPQWLAGYQPRENYFATWQPKWAVEGAVPNPVCGVTSAPFLDVHSYPDMCVGQCIGALRTQLGVNIVGYYNGRCRSAAAQVATQAPSAPQSSLLDMPDLPPFPPNPPNPPPGIPGVIVPSPPPEPLDPDDNGPVDTVDEPPLLAPPTPVNLPPLFNPPPPRLVSPSPPPRAPATIEPTFPPPPPRVLPPPPPVFFFQPPPPRVVVPSPSPPAVQLPSPSPPQVVVPSPSPPPVVVPSPVAVPEPSPTQAITPPPSPETVPGSTQRLASPTPPVVVASPPDPTPDPTPTPAPSPDVEAPPPVAGGDLPTPPSPGVV